jgi:hypothetical protein
MPSLTKDHFKRTSEYVIVLSREALTATRIVIDKTPYLLSSALICFHLRFLRTMRCGTLLGLPIRTLIAIL